MERDLFWSTLLIVFAIFSLNASDNSINTLENELLSSIEYSILSLDVLNDSSTDVDDDFYESVISGLPEHEIIEGKKKNVFPLIINEYVEEQIKYLTETKIDFFKGALKRAQPYIIEMKKIFRDRGLPEELAYLPIIESGFRTYAVSPKGAGGIWQFMPQTASWLGMKVNSWIDERYDPFTACEYAAGFLSFLYDALGNDWYLALASYNYGGVNIKKAVKRAGSDEFYDLVSSKKIPYETRCYVPRFVASVVIIRNIEDYGIDYVEEEHNYKTVVLPFMAPVSLAAKYSSMTTTEFLKYNPALKAGFIPPASYNYKIKIPEYNYNILIENYDTLKSASFENYYVYYIKAGDNLSSISHKYGVTLSILMSVNKIYNANKIWAGQKIYIPITGKKSVNAVSKDETNISYFNYIVKSGETLSHIALKFNISADTIMKMNGIKNPSKIYAGQNLRLYKL